MNLRGKTLRGLFLSLLCGALVFCSACRTPQVSEGGLSARLFATPHAGLTKDGAGLWYVVAPQGQSPTNFVIIEYGGLRFAFVAITVGERAAQVLPLTPVRVDWFNDAMRGEASIDFVDDLETVNIDGGLALWAGQGADSVRWLGAQPRGRQQALVIPARPPARGMGLGQWAAGTMTFEGNRVVAQGGDFAPVDGPYLVLPDGLVKPHGFRVANISGKPIEVSSDATIVIDGQQALPVPEAMQYGFSLMPLGRGLLADAITFESGGRQGFSLVDPAFGRIGRFQRLEASLGEVPFTLPATASVAQIEAALKGLRGIFDNHPLVAAYYLRHLPIEVHGNAHGAVLRRMELIAAAGFGPWMRAELVAGKPGLEADSLLYVARSYAFEGQWQATEIFAAQAYELFGTWPGVAGAIGRGRADLLLAQARAELKDFPGAASFAGRAARHFATINDEAMQATALHQQGLYLFETGRHDDAIEQMQLASDVFERARVPYFALLTQFRLGRRLAEANHADAGRIIAEVNARFEELGEPVAMNRAHLAATAMEVRRSGSRHVPQLIKEHFQIARDQGDRIGAMAAATLLVEERLAETDDDLLEAGTALVFGLVASTESYYVVPAHRALMTLCTRGLPAGVEAASTGAPLVQACEGIRRNIGADVSALPIWLDSGYRHIQMSRWESARRIASDLNGLLTQEFIVDHARVAADILLFQAALVHAEERDAQDLSAFPDQHTMAVFIQRAFDVLKDALSLEAAGPYLFDLAQGFRLRGLDQITLTLMRASVQAARNAGQPDQVARFTLALAESYYEAEDWKSLAALEGPAHAGFARRVGLYRAHGLLMSDDGASAATLRREILEDSRSAPGLQYFAALILAAQLDLHGGELDRAEEDLREALAIEESLQESLVRENSRNLEPLRVLSARLRGLRARLHLRREQSGEGRRAIEEAMAIMSELPADVAPHVRIELLEDAGLLAGSEEEVGHYIELLQLLKTQIEVDDRGRVRQLAIAAQARLEAVRGRSEEAYTILRELFEAGWSPSASRHIADCMIGEIALQAGKQRQATVALGRCARHDTAGERGARARLWLAFADPGQTTAFRVGLVQHLERVYANRLSTREAERLALIKSLSRPRESADPVAQERLLLRFDAIAAGDAALRVQAAQALATHLLATGKAREAEEFLNRQGSAFFEAGEESAATLARLRLEALVHQLRPIDARTYADRVMAEAGPMSDATRASIVFLQAQNYIVLGQWFEAARALGEGLAMAGEAEDAALEQAFEALATKFGLTLSP